VNKMYVKHLLLSFGSVTVCKVCNFTVMLCLCVIPLLCMFFDSSSSDSFTDTIDGRSSTFSHTRVSFSPEISL
jgi:hypothetical protein